MFKGAERMKQSLVKILIDNDELENYVLELEKDIDNTINIDEKVDLILDNILELYNNFKDRRALSARNIEAITNLFKLKSDLPSKRIQTKKQILDIMTKKRELEIKDKVAQANTEIAANSGDILRAIFNQLDKNQIHPDVIDIESEYSDIIDTPLLLEETVKNDIIEETEDSNSIIAMQEELDNIKNEE